MAFTWTRDQRVHLSSVEPAASSFGPDQAWRSQHGGLLVGCYDYLRQHGPTHPGLATAVAALTSAVGAYQAGDAVASTEGIRRTLAAMHDERRRDPSLPEP